MALCNYYWINACQRYMFFYERPVGGIDTPNGPSPSLWHPGAYMIHGTEGYSISTADQNGFMNKDGELAAYSCSKSVVVLQALLDNGYCAVENAGM